MKTRALLTTLAIAAVSFVPATGRAAGATDVAGIPAANVGTHGPKTDYLNGPLELVGKTDLGDGVRAGGNNGGIALIGHCAFVGRWHDYVVGNQVRIVDVANPAAPTVIGTIPGSAVLGAVSREIRAIDLPGFKMLTILTFSHLATDAPTGGVNSLLFFGFNGGDCTKPYLLGSYDLLALRPHEFFQWLDPVHSVNGHPRILEYITSPVDAIDVAVVDASDPTTPSLLSVWQSGIPLASASESNLVGGVPAGAGNYTHSISISADGTRAYVSHWDGGFFTMDTSDFANAAPAPVFKPLGLPSVPLAPASPLGNTHSAVKIPGQSAVVEGGEIYVTTDGCPFGWLRTDSLGDATSAPSKLGEFKLPENNSANCANGMVTDTNDQGKPIDGTFTMHNQTIAGNFVITSWYGGGLRVIDVSDPASPSETAFFVPAPAGRDPTGKDKDGLAVQSLPQTTAPAYGFTASTGDDWRVATWSYPIIRNGYIYVSDIRNGLYILKATTGTPLADELNSINFVEGNSNFGDFA